VWRGVAWIDAIGERADFGSRGTETGVVSPGVDIAFYAFCGISGMFAFDYENFDPIDSF
jgi:hypothetical protein